MWEHQRAGHGGSGCQTLDRWPVTKQFLEMSKAAKRFCVSTLICLALSKCCITALPLMHTVKFEALTYPNDPIQLYANPMDSGFKLRTEWSTTFPHVYSCKRRCAPELWSTLWKCGNRSAIPSSIVFSKKHEPVQSACVKQDAIVSRVAWCAFFKLSGQLSFN